MAVIECDPALSPTLKEVVASVVLTLESEPVPITVPPSLNVTVPVGLNPFTVAVNVTVAHWTTGFADDASDVDDAINWEGGGVGVKVIPVRMVSEMLPAELRPVPKLKVA